MAVLAAVPGDSTVRSVPEACRPHAVERGAQRALVERFGTETLTQRGPGAASPRSSGDGQAQ